MSQDLTPEQREIINRDTANRAARDGEAMIAAIQKSKPAAILGADGKSLTPEQTPEERRKESEAAYIKTQIEEHDRLAKRLQEMVAGDKIAASAVEALMDGHRLILWATIELANIDGADDDLLKFADRYLHAAVHHGKGFDIQKLRARLRDVTMPFLNDRLRHYTALGTLRKKAFARVKPAMKDGSLPLPFPGLSGKFENGGFKPKQMLILSGTPEATNLTVYMLRSFFDKRALPVAFLTSADTSVIDAGREAGRNETVMPVKWWGACTEHLHRLYETLRSAVTDERIITLVDSMDRLAPAHDKDEDRLAAKVMAAHRMYQWTVEHSMCTIMADNPIPGQHEELFGVLPVVKVSCDNEYLYVGSDKVELKKGI